MGHRREPGDGDDPGAFARAGVGADARHVAEIGREGREAAAVAGHLDAGSEWFEPSTLQVTGFDVGTVILATLLFGFAVEG